MKKTLLAAGAIALGVSGSAQAQDETGAGATLLDRITVSPNRTPTEKSKVGSKVEQVTEAEISEKSLPTLIDYLARLPGVSVVSSGGVGTLSNVFVRGAPAKYVKTLYNGIDISDPANTQVQTHHEHLLTGGVTGIELLKGSQSTLYGSSAIAGLIDITTADDISDGVRHRVELEGGSFGTVRGRYGFSAAREGSRITANASGFRTDGISAADGLPERDGYDNVTLDLVAEHRINDAFSVFGSLLYVDAKSEYDDFGADNLINHGTSEMAAGRVGFNLDLMDGRAKNTFSVQTFYMNREDVNEFAGFITNSRYTGRRQKFEYQGSFDLTENVLLQYGADHERQSADVDAWSPFDEKHDITGGWTQIILSPVEDLVLTAGLRHDEHSVFGGHTTYRGTASYALPGTGTRFHSSVGTGFRAPSLAELYEAGTGNPNLQPETSLSFDIGVEQAFLDERLVVDVTYFRLDVEDQIVSRWPNPYEQIPGVSRSEGVEASVLYAAAPWLDLGGSYTYTDARTEDGLRQSRRPKHMVTLAASVRPAEKWTISGDVKFVSDTVESGTPLDDYVLLNAKIAYDITDATQIYLRGENLLDEDYQTARGYGTPGISAFAGIKSTF